MTSVNVWRDEECGRCGKPVLLQYYGLINPPKKSISQRNPSAIYLGGFNTEGELLQSFSVAGIIDAFFYSHFSDMCVFTQLGYSSISLPDVEMTNRELLCEIQRPECPKMTAEPSVLQTH